MILTEEEKRMLGGENGPGVQKAMQILVEYGEAFDAQKMARVNSSHILPDPLDWLEQLTAGVDEFHVMSTLHAGSPYATRWRDALGLKADGAGVAAEHYGKTMDIYKQKGAFLTMSCAPYLMGNMVKKNDVFTWAGSSGIIINNSLLGARGNRESGVSMTCSAITGRTPYMLRLQPEGRRAEVLINPQGLDLENFSEADYGAMGYHIGAVANEKNVVIDTLPNTLPFEKLKYLLSPMPVSGAVSLCHLTGITPEASTLEHALHGQKPERQVSVGMNDIRAASAQLSTATSTAVDVVMLGCPHLTIREIKSICTMIEGKSISANVKLWLNTNAGVYALAQNMGYVDIIEKAGGLVITDTCIALFPFAQMKDPVHTVATNSARCAHYASRGGAGELAGGKVLGTCYGSMAACIKAALSGQWEVE